jgi:serine/threonine protein kinase
VHDIKVKTCFIEAKDGDIKTKYRFKKKLGQGGFGTVYLCHYRTDKKPDYNYFAVKSIKKTNIEDAESFRIEI